VIKKINRFSGRSEFLEVKKAGVGVFNSPLFGVLALVKEDKEVRLGWIISKKISKKAVERNKIKRRLSQVLGPRIGKLKPGARIIFLMKKEILGKSLAEIEKEVDKLVVKLEG
jgi:ribonuclease P protein component